MQYALVMTSNQWSEFRVDVDTRNEEEQEPEECGHAVYKSWCAVCVKSRCVGKHLQVEPLEEEERERTTPIVAFDCLFLTQENSDIYPILVCRDNRQGQITILVDLIKDLESLRIILKDENEPSLKVFQEVMIYSCVEVVVREMKNNGEFSGLLLNTSVRITDDIPLLNWIPHFAMQLLNKIRTGRRWRRGAYIICEMHNSRFML